MSYIYGIVLVGCGHIGTVHLDDIYYRDNIKIIGVVDTNIELAKLTAKKYGAQSWSDDYKTYLKDTNVDIFIIATYVNTHLEILRECTIYGKHVLCEKPITAKLEDAKCFIELAKTTPIKVLIGHVLRHNKTYKMVADMIKSGVLGKNLVIRMVQNHHTVD